MNNILIGIDELLIFFNKNLQGLALSNKVYLLYKIYINHITANNL